MTLTFELFPQRPHVCIQWRQIGSAAKPAGASPQSSPNVKLHCVACVASDVVQPYVGADLSFCGKTAQIHEASRLRTSDEPSVRIRLRSALRAVSAERTTKPVSEELFVLELQSSWTVASWVHSGESSAG